MTAARAIVAEAVGTALLVAAVVGSGIMAERLAGGNVAVALLANTIATGGALFALIVTFAPISGAHFNPVVSVHQTVLGGLARARLAGYLIAQIGGGVAGAVIANTMFGLDAVSWSSHSRDGGAQLFSEAVATFGLVGVIASASRHRAPVVPVAVACYIVAAYWFTASTSFANPAVTIARALTDTFAGIQPSSVLPFVLAQLVGAAVAVVAVGYLHPRPAQASTIIPAPLEEHS